ncbi:Fe2+ high-affinity transporter [Acetobacter estunensis NRIC 0472]|uniref:Sugar ABC transporter substrate-binding protein n=1 Tax=Acetobacter estunensis TaxID=104097 RepID=A0A967B3E4_9PROT|nr:iron transporter [Acetobacter estunensis]NHO52985.1 sugar ABC transporter substrate-binding protein [Acetobacter estunensis]GBQ29621.1 Fe2+ high-affinity transporter [Acetobacter estunensis NRIC 0472]
MKKAVPVLSAAGLAAALLASPALAREYPVGGPVQTHDMEIASSYLVGIEMAPMPADMPMGDDVIHLETDVHATADNQWGFPEGAWVPYLKIDYTLTKKGSSFKAAGTMRSMTAKDGPHYANNVKMDGPGDYTVVLTYSSPEVNGFLHHVDKETGTPGFWQPFTETFTFKYPQK